MLRAHRNTVADRDGDFFTVSAGPFSEVFVGVSEDYFHSLPCHVLNDTSHILGNESKCENRPYPSPVSWLSQHVPI